MIKWILVVLAVLGLAAGIWTMATSNLMIAPPPPASKPTINPFPRGLASLGLVESASREVAVAAPEPGLVTAVYVQANDAVKKNQELFQLDTRAYEADLRRAEAALEQARVELARLKALPRPEDLPPLKAAVEYAQALLNDAREEHQQAIRAQKAGAATEYEVQRRLHTVNAAAAKLTQAQTELARIAAGAWGPELDMAQAQVRKNQADVELIRVQIQRLKILSPIDGIVLKRSIEVGEFAQADPQRPLLVVGDLSRMNIRAQIDEEDMPHLRPDASAVAQLRGDAEHPIALKFLRIEPLAAAKRALTGAVQERVDTRVVEVIYQVTDPNPVRLYPGQAVDVFIQIP